jgi:polar amino acid transport system substrate-binding protein
MVAFALVVAACGGGDSDDTTTTAADGDTTTTEAPSGGEFEGQTITVAVENAYTPFNFVDEATGEAIGFDYDIWREICTRLGCTAEFVEAGWPAVIEETGQGQYDVAADGISITDDRKEVVDFSEPYMVVEQKFMVRLGEDRFTSAQEFIDGDYRLGTQVGTTNFELGESLVGGDRIDAYQDFGVAVQALISGDVDAVIIDDVAGQGYQGVNADAITLLPDSLQSDPLGFIYEKGSPLVAAVDAVLAEMDADGTLDELIATWFIEFEA